MKKLEREFVHAVLPSESKTTQTLPSVVRSDTEQRIYMWEKKVQGLRVRHQMHIANKQLRRDNLVFACLRDLTNSPEALVWRAYYRSLWKKGKT